MRFGIYVSFDDHTQYYGTWGEPGVMYILDRVQAAGFDSVYWRMGSGQAMYPSRVGTPLYKYKDFNIMDQAESDGIYTSGTATRWYNRVSHAAFDCPRAAIDFGREIGLSMYSWSEIDAEAHGWGNESDFYDQHPEFRSTNRGGKQILGRLSWGKEEAVAYRRALIREHLAYGFDRIYLDFYKGGDHRIALYDEEGARMDMYDDCVVRAFQEKTGTSAHDIPNNDPEWIQFRADYVTEWLRGMRRMQRALYPSTELCTFVTPPGTHHYCDDWNMHPPKGKMGAEGVRTIAFKDPLSGNYEDIATWTREGLVDRLQLCLNPDTIGGKQLPDRQTLAIKMAELRAIMERELPVSVKLYGYARNDAACIEETALALQNEGVEEMVICESAPLERMPGSWSEYRKAIGHVKEKLSE